MNSLHDIVTMTIDIASPEAESASFDGLLIAGLPPVNPVGDLPDVGIYYEMADLASAGYVFIGEDADPVGVAARIAFAQNPRPEKIYVAVQQETDDGLEPIVDTLNRAYETPGWYGLALSGVDESEYDAVADWTERNSKLFGYTFLSTDDPVSNVYFRSHGWCGLESGDQEAEDAPENNRYLHVALMAKCLSYPAGSETWAFKQLSGISPSSLSDELKKLFIQTDSNFFTRYSGKNISMNGKTRAGEWIDVIRGRDWLLNDMQTAIFQLLLVNSKIPFLNNGIALIETAIRSSLLKAQKQGIVAEDEYDDEGELIAGFTVSVPTSASISAAEKAARKLTRCTFSARLAGAIHLVKVNGTLSY